MNKLNIEDIKIMIVDDNEITVKEESKILKSKGFKLICEVFPENAIEVVKNYRPDIIVIDYLMVDITGLQIINQIREFNKEAYIILFVEHPELISCEKAITEYDIDSYSYKDSSVNPVVEDLYERLLIASKTVKKHTKHSAKINIEKFPVKLKRLRKNHKMVQDDVAKILGVTRSTIANYESGINTPPVKQVKKIAELFSVTIDYMLS